MQTLATNGITIYFEPQERDTAELVYKACQRSLRLMNEHWGVDVPQNSRVYIMTSWRDFMFQSAIGRRRILLKLAYPLWARRVQQMWDTSSGWNLPNKGTPVIGIKPGRLIQGEDPSIHGQLFTEDENDDIKVEKVCCHVLAHAFISHLKLPMWLREGFAMLTVDRYFERSTVKSESLELLTGEYSQFEAQEYRKIVIKDPNYTAFQIGRGYWLTRYLDETHPEFLRSLLAKQLPRPELEARVAAALEIEPDELWDEVDALLVNYFQQKEVITE